MSIYSPSKYFIVMRAQSNSLCITASRTYRILKNGIFGIFFICCLAQLNSFQGEAQEIHSAQELYDQGDYKQASLAAEKQNDLEGYGLAVRAALVYGGYVARDIEAIQWLGRAERLSKIAMKMDGTAWRNRLSASLVIGYKAKKRHSVVLVNQAKILIEGLIADYPNEEMAHGALAGWHSEISAAGFFPRLAFGASRELAGENFKVARSLNDAKIPLNIEYAKYLARGDENERKSAGKILITIIEAVPHDAFEQMLQGNAKKLLIALNSGKKQEIKTIIAEISAFPDF